MKVNILEAKTNLSNLVRMVETGEEETIVIVWKRVRPQRTSSTGGF